VCGILLLTLAEIEAHLTHTAPVKHLHVESYADFSADATNVSAIMSSGAISTAAADDVAAMVPWWEPTIQRQRIATPYQWNQD
jgi:hypothetical protein